MDTVIVDGNILMDERTVLSIDEGGALDLGQEESLKLIERAGLQSHVHEPGWGKPRLEFDAPLQLPRCGRPVAGCGHSRQRAGSGGSTG